MTRNTIAMLLPLLAAAALAGCSPEPEAGEQAEVDQLKTGILEHIASLEQQAAGGTVKCKTVENLLTSLNQLIGRMKGQKIGTDEQLATLEDLRVRLADTGAGRGLPPRDWRPDSGQKPPEPTAPAAAVAPLLPQIREAVEAVTK